VCKTVQLVQSGQKGQQRSSHEAKGVRQQEQCHTNGHWQEHAAGGFHTVLLHLPESTEVQKCALPFRKPHSLDVSVLFHEVIGHTHGRTQSNDLQTPSRKMRKSSANFILRRSLLWLSRLTDPLASAIWPSA
jgi:hypothetical protein